MVLCQVLHQSTKEEEWTDVREQLRNVSRTRGVKKAGHRVLE